MDVLTRLGRVRIDRGNCEEVDVGYNAVRRRIVRWLYGRKCWGLVGLGNERGRSTEFSGDHATVQLQSNRYTDTDPYGSRRVDHRRSRSPLPGGRVSFQRGGGRVPRGL